MDNMTGGSKYWQSWRWKEGLMNLPVFSKLTIFKLLIYTILAGTVSVPFMSSMPAFSIRVWSMGMLHKWKKISISCISMWYRCMKHLCGARITDMIYAREFYIIHIWHTGNSTSAPFYQYETTVYYTNVSLNHDMIYARDILDNTYLTYWQYHKCTILPIWN
jgi:hypothetical protein